MCVAGAAAAGLGSGRAPPSCRRRLGWWRERSLGPTGGTGDGTDTVSAVGPARPAASVLEFCLVFCTVSGLGQSSLWSLTVHWILLSYLP